MFKDLSIKGRVLLLTLLPTSLLALVLGGYFTWVQLSGLQTQLLQRGEMLVEHLAPLAAPALEQKDVKKLERIAQQALEHPDVRAVGFLAPERKSLAHAGPSMLNPTPVSLPGVSLLSGQDATRFLLPVYDQHLVLDDALDDERTLELLGWVELELSHQSTLLSGYRSLFASLLLIVGGLAVTALLALRMSRSINGPLREIKAGVAQLKDGHLQTRLPPLGSHEMDELAAGINRMAEALQNAQEELQHSIEQATEDVRQNLETIEIQNIELDFARKEALEASRIKSEFLANMSHEIRTPLNGLLGMLALALDGPLSAEQRQQLGIAHDSGKVLVELLNDILDLSKFEAGQLELEEIPFDLGALAEETASLLSQNAASAVELTCLIDPALPAQVLGDPTRVRQIVSNLLSNALKFTRFGRVDLIVACSKDGISIRVRDTGIGIAADAQARIFQPFAQAEVGITREYGGTGLGLALTRRLCEAMHGKLTLQSKEGFGSEFCAELPLPAHAQAATQPSLQGRIVAMTPASSGLQQMLSQWLPTWGLSYQRLDTDASLLGVDADLLISDCPECLLGIRPTITTPVLLVTAYGNFLPHDQAQRLMPLLQIARPLARTGLLQMLRHILQSDEGDLDSSTQAQSNRESSARVLLVEDNPVNQMVAKGMLAKLGYQVLVAGHGGEALEILEQQPVDLVLMDCNMPVMDGYEASRRIRSNGRWPELPIVALTANALSDERERCRAAGMNDYLAKPFRREELAAMLDTWLPSDVTR